MRRKLNKFERERVSLKALKARRGKVRALPPPPERKGGGPGPGGAPAG